MERQWSEDLSIGIELLDSQHKELFQHISRLRAAWREGEGRDTLLKTLRFLEEYVAVQFNAEEAYMRRFNYPGLNVHEEEHKDFVKVLSEYRRKFQELDPRAEITQFLSMEIARKLSDWLADHIKSVDKNMGAFLAGKLQAINNPALAAGHAGRWRWQGV